MTKRFLLTSTTVAILACLTACTPLDPEGTMTSLANAKTDTHGAVDDAMSLLPTATRLDQTPLMNFASQCDDEADAPRQWQYRVNVTFDDSVDVKTTALNLVTDLAMKKWTIRKDVSSESEVNLFLARKASASHPIDNLHVTSSPRTPTAPGSIAIGSASACFSF